MTVVEDYETIIGELEAYGGVLATKTRITALNKVDAMDPDELDEKRKALEEAVGGPVHLMSGVSAVRA